MTPETTSVESVEFAYPAEDIGADQHGFDLVYESSSVTERKLFGLSRYTGEGIPGEYVGGITGGIKRANVSEGFGRDMEFRPPRPTHRHRIGAVTDTNYHELALVPPDYSNVQPPDYGGDYSDILDTVVDLGTVNVPDGQGLGVDYSWGHIEDNATGSVHTYN